MPQYVKISLLGPPALRIGDQTHEQFLETTLEHWRKQIERVLPDRPDLIAIPETCDTCEINKDAASLQASCAARGSRVLDVLAGIARRHRCYVTYPAIRRLPDGTLRNSVQLIDRNGDVAGIYDKTHPTIGEIEWGILPGKGATIIQTDFGRVGVAICFDLNFELLRRQYVELRPDLMLFCSLFHGGLVQAYWAYSIRAHFVGAVANLPCQAYAPNGRMLASSTNYVPLVTTTLNLDAQLAHLDYHWDKLEQLKRQYGPEVTIDDTGLLGSVLISSERRGVSAKQMLDEYGIAPLDAYLDRSAAAQDQARP